MFWNAFYNLCTARGVKPNNVAKATGMSSGVVSKWKNTGSLPTGEALIKIADYLNCSVDYLLGRCGIPDSTVGAAEAELLNQYEILNSDGKNKLQEYLADLTDNSKYTSVSNNIADDMLDTINSVSKKIPQLITKQK